MFFMVKNYAKLFAWWLGVLLQVSKGEAVP